LGFWVLTTFTTALLYISCRDGVFSVTFSFGHGHANGMNGMEWEFLAFLGKQVRVLIVCCLPNREGVIDGRCI
jgi:hypothetical protein